MPHIAVLIWRGAQPLGIVDPTEEAIAQLGLQAHAHRGEQIWIGLGSLARIPAVTDRGKGNHLQQPLLLPPTQQRQGQLHRGEQAAVGEQAVGLIALHAAQAAQAELLHGRQRSVGQLGARPHQQVDVAAQQAGVLAIGAPEEEAGIWAVGINAVVVGGGGVEAGQADAELRSNRQHVVAAASNPILIERQGGDPTLAVRIHAAAGEGQAIEEQASAVLLVDADPQRQLLLDALHQRQAQPREPLPVGGGDVQFIEGGLDDPAVEGAIADVEREITGRERQLIAHKRVVAAIAVAVGERQHIGDAEQIGLAEVHTAPQAAGLKIAAVVHGGGGIEGAGADGLHPQHAHTGLGAGGEVGTDRFDQGIGLQQAQFPQQPRHIQHATAGPAQPPLDVGGLQPAPTGDAHLTEPALEDADLHRAVLAGLQRDEGPGGGVTPIDVQLGDGVARFAELREGDRPIEEAGGAFSQFSVGEHGVAAEAELPHHHRGPPGRRQRSAGQRRLGGQGEG